MSWLDAVRSDSLTQWATWWPALDAWATPLPPIRRLVSDSRLVKPGDTFVALNAAAEAHIPSALSQGAVLAICEGSAALESPFIDSDRLYLPQWSEHLGPALARFSGLDQSTLKITAVTGTNGKSSIVHYLTQLDQQLGYSAAMLGTLGYGPLTDLQPASHTTPDLLTLHRLLSKGEAQGWQRVSLEASSHALDQGRLQGVPIETAILTNLTHDHLDYHGSLEAYAQAKARLFHWPTLKAQVINLDDALGQRLLQTPFAGQRLTYSLKDPSADLYLAAWQATPTGVAAQLVIDGIRHEVLWPLLGEFNLANLLAVIAARWLQGDALDALLTAASQLQPVPGRMQRINTQEPTKPQVILDYAHTPDALQQVLASLRAHCQGRLICVFGCGGNRDAGKRPLMGQIAAQGADQVWVTDDNPRHENPAQIRQQILHACPDGIEVADRAEAIAAAIAQAAPDDWVLLAGKGHETDQQIGDQRLPFDDRDQAMRALAQWSPHA